TPILGSLALAFLLSITLLVLDEAKRSGSGKSDVDLGLYGSNYNDRPGGYKPATDLQRLAGLGALGVTCALTLTGGSDVPHPLAQPLINSDVYCIAEKKLIYDCADRVPVFFAIEYGTCAIGEAGNFTSDLSPELQIRECDKKITELEHQLAMSNQRQRSLRMRSNDAAVERDDELRLLSRAAQSSFKDENCKECDSHFGAYLEALFPRRKFHLFIGSAEPATQFIELPRSLEL
ncbi:hypothetical protein MMC29_007022, partial [Sticta canariensis]|nr:hypothetical protein [Sticta canariensis]